MITILKNLMDVLRIARSNLVINVLKDRRDMIFAVFYQQLQDLHVGLKNMTLISSK